MEIEGIEKISKLIVSDELFKFVNDLNDEKIEEIFEKQDNDSLTDTENAMIESVEKHFGEEFFDLSKSGRENRIKTVESQNNKLKEIIEKMKKITINVRNPIERKKQLENAIEEIEDLEKGTKTFDILKQNKITWNIYKFVKQACYNHPLIMLAVIGIPGVVVASSLNLGLIFGLPAIAAMVSPVFIAQYNKRIKKKKPDFENNLFTGKNSLRNALFKKKNAEKIISAIKGIDLEKVSIKKETTNPDTDKESDEKSFDDYLNDVNEMMEDEKGDSKDSRRRLFEENRKKLKNLIPMINDFILNGGIKKLDSFINSIRSFEKDLNADERKYYNKFIEAKEKWDKINNAKQFLKSYDDTSLRNLELKDGLKILKELVAVRDYLDANEQTKMVSIWMYFKAKSDCNEILNVYSKKIISIFDDDNLKTINEEIELIKTFEDELGDRAKDILKNMIDARDSYLSKRIDIEKAKKAEMIRRININLNDYILFIDIEVLEDFKGLSLKDRNSKISSITNMDNFSQVNENIDAIERIKRCLNLIIKNNLVNAITIDDVDKFAAIADLGMIPGNVISKFINKKRTGRK